MGFEWAGIQILSAYDTDPFAVSSYNHNLKKRALEQDVSSLASISPDLDLIIATPPCQGFSTAGGYRYDDPRNNLFLTSCNIISQSKPKVAVIENVAAITNRRNKPLLESGLKTLVQAGYHVELKVLACEEYGVPQRRKRAFVIARSEGRYFCAEKLDCYATKTTLEDVFSDLSSEMNAHDPKFLEKGTKHYKIARAIKSGGKLSNVRAGPLSVPTWEIPDVFGQTTKEEKLLLCTVRSLRRRNRKRKFGDADPVSLEEIQYEIGCKAQNLVSRLVDRGYLRKVGPLFDLTNTFNGKYRRLKLSDSSPTVDTRFGDHQLFLHPFEHRGLTIREAARIQGFPDDFLFFDKPRISFRLIGNAVPPPVARRVATFVRSLV